MKDKRGASLVTVMIIVAIASLFLRIAVEGLIKINIEQNESNAQATLKLISASLEIYAKDNQGVFPTNLSALSSANPPYLDKDYSALSSFKGYNYSCPILETSGYNCSATPVKCNITGKTIYSIATGGSFASEECSPRE